MLDDLQLKCVSTITLILCLFNSPAVAAPSKELLINPDFSQAGEGGKQPAHFVLSGNARYTYLGVANQDASTIGVALLSALPAKQPASVSQTLDIIARQGQWYRFACIAMAQDKLVLDGQTLRMKVAFFADHGKTSLDGKSVVLDSQIAQDRHDLNANGDQHREGAAVWRSYTLDVRIPFDQIDQVRASIELDKSLSLTANNSAFYISRVSLTAIDVDPLNAASTRPALTTRPAGNLIALGGRWYYLASPDHPAAPPQFDHNNVDQLYYHDSQWTTPFAGNVSAVLRSGDKDAQGNIVTEDRLIADNVTVKFDRDSLILNTHSIPNHPTGKFPEQAGVPWWDPSYITEQVATYYFPLNPKVNPNHLATTTDNSNRALNMGPIGVAINGVVFYNPFDANSQDASSIMDRCCGHPDPSGLYHYHKYPICINSPWDDKGVAHSALIGFAFDGFPVYGPYEDNGVLAMSVKGANALNAFNLHFDSERSWHYHVTPGRFPYIIGGYWGTVDARDTARRGPPGGGRGPGGMGGPGGPGGGRPPFDGPPPGGF